MGLISRRCLSSAAMNRRAPPTSSGPVLRENEVEQKLLWQFQNGTFEPPVNPKELTMEGVGLNRSAVMQIVEAMFTTRIAHNITRREAATGGRVHYTIGPGKYGVHD